MSLHRTGLGADIETGTTKEQVLRFTPANVTYAHMWSCVLPTMVVTSHGPEVKKVTDSLLSCAICVKLSSPTASERRVKRDKPSNEDTGGSIYW